MTSTGWVPLIVAAIAGLITVWGIWHQRLGRLGRVRLVKEQLELLDALDGDFGEAADRVRRAIERELDRLYPLDRIRRPGQVLGALIFGGATLYPLISEWTSSHSKPTLLDGLVGGILVGLAGIFGASVFPGMSNLGWLVRSIASGQPLTVDDERLSGEEPGAK